jgi:hypothetical protein
MNPRIHSMCKDAPCLFFKLYQQVENVMFIGFAMFNDVNNINIVSILFIRIKHFKIQNGQRVVAATAATAAAPSIFRYQTRDIYQSGFTAGPSRTIRVAL